MQRVSAEQLFARIIQNTRHVRYNVLLAVHCALPRDFKEKKRQVNKLLRERGSGGISLSSDEEQQLFDYVYASCSDSTQVFNFVRAVVRRIVPRDFFGTRNLEPFYV